MESGFKYLLSIYGALKFFVVTLSCITFALLAASGRYSSSSALKWVLAAFIISFSISLFFMVFRVIGLNAKMECGGPCSYDGFDFIWSWFCTSWCFAAAVTFAANFPQSSNAEAIVSIIFAFLTFMVYAAEAFYLRSFAPANFGFVATKQGWIKTLLVVFGAATFGLMVDSGYPNGCQHKSDGCVEGLTYSLVAFTVSWSVTTIIWIVHIIAPKESLEDNDKLRKAEIIWALIGVLFFWTGASVLAAYMSKDCNSYADGSNCQKRLSGVIAGYLTGLLYLIEIFMLRF